MTPEDVRLWLQIATGLISVLAVVVAFFATRRKEINERLSAGSKRMDGFDLTIQAMQTQIQNMPGKDDQHRVELAISRMSGDLKEVRAQLGANGELMTRVMTVLERQESYLLENGSGK